MSKQVLILSSSPRRGGNSDILCDEFLRGAQDAGHHAEKIFLKDVDIHDCLGCGACFNRKTRCPQKDGMAEILEKMVAADVIVMATPVYFYSLAAQMKRLIDRCCSRYTEMRNQDFYFLMTAADSTPACMERTLECFRGFTDCLSGAKEKGVVYGVGAWNVGEISQTDAPQQAYSFGKNV